MKAPLQAWNRSLCLALQVSILLAAFALAPNLPAATIVIINNDAAGEGMNDPAPFTPVGGNTATTLGQARLNAFQHAANIWGTLLVSPVTIEVAANFDVLPCSPSSGVIGQAGTTTVHWDFPGALEPNTHYPQALANALAGTDEAPANADIGATFNSEIDEPGCLNSFTWYYGLDALPPAGGIDFVTVALHEIGHGLGFATYVDLTTGSRLLERNDVYMLNLEQHDATPSAWPDMNNAQRAAAAISDPDLHWIGSDVITLGAAIPLIIGADPNGHVRAHGPSPLALGQSVSHFSSVLTPTELMEPFYQGANHNPGLALALLHDIGWPAGSPDSDGDGVPDASDNCISVSNPSQTDSDGDGVGDVCDICPGFDDKLDSNSDGIPDGCDSCCDLAGDANNSGSINISDATFLIGYIFSGGSAPPCLDEGDANGSNSITIADATYIIAFIFSGGSTPVCGTTGL